METKSYNNNLGLFFLRKNTSVIHHRALINLPQLLEILKQILEREPCTIFNSRNGQTYNNHQNKKIDDKSKVLSDYNHSYTDATKVQQ